MKKVLESIERGELCPLTESTIEGEIAVMREDCSNWDAGLPLCVKTVV